MPEVVPFESQEALINNDIQSEVDRIRSTGNYTLPSLESDIVKSYVRKIEGTYDVGRAKKDTDNAIDLLYIAYNTTPQEEGDVRVKISGLMNKLITAQQSSERTMRGAIRIAEGIIKSLGDICPDWLSIKGEDDQKGVKDFVGKDLIGLAKAIKTKALLTRDSLLAIAGTYDDIIKDTIAATSSSEKTLSGRLKDKAAIEKEINDSDAKRQQLETLVGELREEVKKFEEMARKYESRAETAEERAFILSIVQIGAQMISSAVPAIAMAAAGPEAMMATSALGALKGQAAGGAGEAGSGSGKPVTEEEVVKVKTKISEQKADIKKSEGKQAALESDIKALKKEKDKLTEGDSAATSRTATSGTATSSSSAAIQIAALDGRIEAKTKELTEEKATHSKLLLALYGLVAALEALEKGLGKLSEQQQQQAAGLRDLQMKMIDKADTYEKERRIQSAELVKINALLKGKRSEEETILLAIKSLNLSLTALKRTKEIVEEIAFFFKSFADFMEGVAAEATEQADNIDGAVESETIRKNRLAQLIKSVDEFFIRQAAEWHAVTIVSDKFNRSFADGWSKLNKLNGEYITGDKLNTYLHTASVTLAGIVEEREAAADRKIASLNSYREKIRGTG